MGTASPEPDYRAKCQWCGQVEHGGALCGANENPVRVHVPHSHTKLFETDARDRDTEKGFSLLELAIALMVGGVFIAIAVPGLHRVADNVKTNSTETGLTAAAQYETVVFVTKSSYGTAAELTTIAPQVIWTSQLPSIAGSNSVTVDSTPLGAPANTVLLGERSDGGLYYWVEMAGEKATFATEKAATEPTYRVVTGPSWASATTLS